MHETGTPGASAAPGERGPFHALTDDDPARVGGYRLVARLGSGGMGHVYLSYTPGGRPVAVKVIRSELSGDQEFRRRFQQEVRAAERVHGLFTAPVIDSDPDAEAPWLVTAYVPGPSLAAAVARHGALPVESVLLLVAGIAEALQSVHGAGIVHRDLKPSNVLLAADGPRVIDFGIARAADATTLTVAGLVVGTPSFMSPEQAMGRPVGPATDVFTLGQVAAFAATGGSAFGEGSGPAVLYRVVHETPDVDAVPGPLRGLVSRCLAKQPADRPSLTDVIAACREAAGTRELRRAEDWLPARVVADLGRTPPLPAAGATRPHSDGGPAQAAGKAPAAKAPDAAPAQQPAPAPAQAQPDVPPRGPAPATGPAASPRALRARVLLGLAVAAALAVAGVSGYALAPDGTDGTGSADDSAARPGPADDHEPHPSSTPDPTPTVYDSLELPDSYHLFLRDTPIEPTRSGAWNRDEIDFRYHAGRFRTRDGNKLAQLSASAKGTLESCRGQTAFVKNIEADEVPKGGRICLLTSDGHAALVTVREVPATKPVPLAVTVWRDAVPPG